MRGETVAALDKSEATGKAKKQLQKKDKVERVEKDDDEEEETEEGDDGEEVEEGEEDDEEEEEEEEGEEEDEDEDDEDEEDDEEEMEAIDSDDEEAIYKKELEAEAAGIPFSEFESKMRKVGKPKVKVCSFFFFLLLQYNGNLFLILPSLLLLGKRNPEDSGGEGAQGLGQNDDEKEGQEALHQNHRGPEQEEALRGEDGEQAQGHRRGQE